MLRPAWRQVNDQPVLLAHHLDDDVCATRRFSVGQTFLLAPSGVGGSVLFPDDRIIGQARMPVLLAHEGKQIAEKLVGQTFLSAPPPRGAAFFCGWGGGGGERTA